MQQVTENDLNRENIRILRLINGFSQEHLELSAGVNTSTLGRSNVEIRTLRSKY